MKKRIDWLDISKFFAIFFMVVCHTVVPRTFDGIVHAFHMPIFFIVSGWCFNIKKHSKFKNFIISRTKTLLIPYFFWGILLYLGWTAFYYFYNSNKLISIKNFLYYFLYSNAENSPFCAVQWFLSCMFFVQIISWCVIKIFKSRFIPVLFSAILLGVLGWGISYILPFRLPLALDVAVSSSGFYLVGWMIPNCIIPKLKSRYKKILFNPVTLILEIVLGVGFAYINGYVNMRLIDFKNPILFYLSAVLLSLAIMHFSFYAEKIFNHNNVFYKTVVFWGQNTLHILVLNQVFIQALKLIICDSSFCAQLNLHQQYILWFIISIGIMLLMVPVIHFTNRLIPFSVGKSRRKQP